MADPITSPILLDETGQHIASLLGSIASSQALIADGYRSTALANMSEVAHIVRSGLASSTFAIGDQIVVPWRDGETEYEMPFDVVHFEQVTLADGETVPGMWIQAHYALPFATCYDQPEAFYVAPSGGLSAGTYSITLPAGYDTSYGGGLTYHFTLTSALPEGGCLTMSWPYQHAPASVSAWSSLGATTATETATLTTGESGTNLGTLDGEDLHLAARVRYGNNRWRDSNLRQWLNSQDAAGSWFTATHAYDKAPAYATSKAGFLAGFDADFVAALGRPVVRTALCTTDSADLAYDETADLMILPSLDEHWYAPEAAEGPAWEYWERASARSTPVPRAQAFAPFKTFGLNARTTARYCWLRSACRSPANYAWYVYASGGANYGSVCNGFYAAPACCIC